MENKKEDNIDITELVTLMLLSIIPILLIYITLIGFTFWFIEAISYTLGFWVYGILSSFLGLALTQYVIKKATT